MSEAIPDYYKILGVSSTASQEEIRQAFLALQNKYHPDRYKGADANERTIEINQAWEWLRSPERRAMYDAYRREQSGETLNKKAAEEFIRQKRQENEEYLERLARQKRQENEEEIRRQVEEERERLKREAEQLVDEAVKEAIRRRAEEARQQREQQETHRAGTQQQRTSGGFSTDGPFRPSPQYQSKSTPITHKSKGYAVGTTTAMILVVCSLIVGFVVLHNLPPAGQANTPPQPHLGAVLYKADWSQGLSNWHASSHWKVSNGMLTNDGSELAWYGTITVPFTPPSADYAIEAEIQLVTYGFCANFGIIGRAIAGQGGKGEQAGVDRCSNDSANIWTVNNNDLPETAPNHTPTSASRYPLDKGWHKYLFVLQGTTLKFYIDNELWVSGSSTLAGTAGNIGLWSYQAVINVRSLTVYAVS